MRMNSYRYACYVWYRELCKNTKLPLELLRYHFYQFNRTMQQFNKNKYLRNYSVQFAKQQAALFFYGEYHLKDYLKKIEKSHYFDFYTYELFFSFLIFYAFKGLYHNKNTNRIVRFLRDLQVVDWERLRAYACCDEKRLLTDPDYADMDRESKLTYRKIIMKTAKNEGNTPSKIIEKALNRAKKNGKHIGFYLKMPSNTIKKWLYFIFLWGSTLIMCAQLYLISKNVWLSGLMLIPAYVTSKIFTNHFISSFIKPHKFLRLKFDSNKVKYSNVCVVIYALLKENSDELLEKIEETYLKNRNVNGSFGLLLDFPDDIRKLRANERTAIANIQAGIEALNKKYGKLFFASVRRRTFCREREKYVCLDGEDGAIDFLIRTVQTRKTDYLFVLDKDTETTEGAIWELLRVACHPMNQEYGIFLPKVAYRRSTLNSKMHNVWNQIIYEQEIFDGIGLISITDYKKTMPISNMASNQLRTAYVSDILCVNNSCNTVFDGFVHESTSIRRDFLRVMQKNITRTKRWMLWERCLYALTPVFSFVIIMIAAFLERKYFGLYFLSSCMPYFAPTYKRFIHQILTGSAATESTVHENNMSIILSSLYRSLWKISLIPYRALNTVWAIRRPNETKEKRQDIFAWYPFLAGMGINLFLGVYFLMRVQWSCLIFLIWANVPAMIYIITHIKAHKVNIPKGRMYPND